MKSDYRQGPAPVSTGAVRAHYDELACTYERKSNRACKRVYRWLIRRCLHGADRVLELGAGAGCLLRASDARFKVACDLSLPMLLAGRDEPHGARVVADAHQTPFGDARFDGAFCVNMLEHVANPDRAMAEVARMLVPGGRCLAVTPNGDIERLLDILEKLHLKLPEGPHRFLTFEALARTAGDAFDIVEHRRFAALPAGPRRLVHLIDRIVHRVYPGLGFMQYILLRKRG